MNDVQLLSPKADVLDHSSEDSHRDIQDSRVTSETRLRPPTSSYGMLDFFLLFSLSE